MIFALTMATIIVVLGSGDLSLASGERQSLKVVMPQASFFSGKEGDPPHYKAYDGEKNLIGLCFLTTDVEPYEMGYVGPIKIMIGMDLDGTITGIKILRHMETPEYVEALEEPWFSGQFRGKTIHEPLEVGKDIHGITGATITVNAVARMVRKSTRKMWERYSGLKVPPQKKMILPRLIGPQFLLLFTLCAAAIVGLVKRNRWVRLAVLGVAAIWLGFYKKGPLSILSLTHILFLRFPSIFDNLFWYLLFGFTIAGAALVGRFWCGWLCPFGAVQEFLNKLPSFSLKLPTPVDYGLRYIKYGLLFVTLASFPFKQEIILADLEPFGVLFTLKGPLLDWLWLIVILGISIVIFRPFCRYLCMVGAFLALVSKLGVGKIKVAGKCTHCQKCFQICPTESIKARSAAAVKINYGECIRCEECRRVCPEGALK